MIAALPTNLKLTKMYCTEDTGYYMLKALVCYGGQHYISYIFNETNMKWAKYDDEIYRTFHSKYDMIIDMIQGWVRPVGVFFQRRHQRLHGFRLTSAEWIELEILALNKDRLFKEDRRMDEYPSTSAASERQSSENYYAQDEFPIIAVEETTKNPEESNKLRIQEKNKSMKRLVTIGEGDEILLEQYHQLRNGRVHQGQDLNSSCSLCESESGDYHNKHCISQNQEEISHKLSKKCESCNKRIKFNEKLCKVCAHTKAKRQKDLPPMNPHSVTKPIKGVIACYCCLQDIDNRAFCWRCNALVKGNACKRCQGVCMNLICGNCKIGTWLCFKCQHRNYLTKESCCHCNVPRFRDFVMKRFSVI